MWPDTYLDSRFRGVIFDCLSLGEEITRATVAHSYPFRDGAEIEDLGLQATRHKVRATLFGNNADRQLQQLKDALDAPGSGEWVHPIYGLLHVVVEGYSPAFDADSTDSVALDISFVESSPRAAFFDLAIPEAKLNALEASSADTFSFGASAFTQTLRSSIAQANNSRLAQLVATMSQSVTQLSQLGAAVQNSVQSYLDAPAAFLSDINNMMGGLIPHFGLPGSGVSAAVGVNSAGSTVSPVQNFYSAQNQLAQATAAAPILAGSTVAQIADAALIASGVQMVATLTLLRVASGILTQELAVPSATPQQIEVISNAVRASIQAQIDALPAIYPLELNRPVIESFKNAALLVQQVAKLAIETRPPLIVRPAPVAGNLRLIAHAMYGDHSRASELFRLNPALRAPNFVAQGDMLNAFSK